MMKLALIRTWFLTLAILLLIMVAMMSNAQSRTRYISPKKARTAALTNIDTVYIGFHLQALREIDINSQLIMADLWVWGNYPKTVFDDHISRNSPTPITSLEFITKKDPSITYDTTTTERLIYQKKGRNWVWEYANRKGMFYTDWKIERFPFDQQTIKIVVDDSYNICDSVCYIFEDGHTDTLRQKKGLIDPIYVSESLRDNGWRIKDTILSKECFKSITNWGNPDNAYEVIPRFTLTLNLVRDQQAHLFWKLFLGMYVAFVIACIVFFVPSSDLGSRFSLSVGAMFSALGNKYVIDSVIPETTNFTVVDYLHQYTFIFIMITIVYSVIDWNIMQKFKISRRVSQTIDHGTFWMVLFMYIVLNCYIIMELSNVVFWTGLLISIPLGYSLAYGISLVYLRKEVIAND